MSRDDQIGLGGDAEAKTGGGREYFQDRAGDAIAALGGLVRIGRRADRDGFAQRKTPQFLPETRRVEMFGEDFALELQRIAQLHEFVSVAGIAILAAEFAAAIGIDRPAKRHARAVASGQEYCGVARSKYSTARLASRRGLSAASRAIPTRSGTLHIRLLFAFCQEHWLFQQ